MDARNLLDSLSCPVIPVIVIDQLDDAVPLAEALLCGGLSAVEVTLRTPAGYEAIRKIKAAFPDAVIGAGTVCSEHAYRQAVEVGADFIVAPGATETLYRTAQAFSVPFLPGAVTGSEVLSALEQGCSSLKFFPAETPAARQPSEPRRALPRGEFMPTGGITPDNVSAYLRLSNVCAVGGSWLSPRSRLRISSGTRSFTSPQHSGCYLAMTESDVSAVDLIIFGATGDLSARKLFPALFELDAGALAG